MLRATINTGEISWEWYRLFLTADMSSGFLFKCNMVTESTWSKAVCLKQARDAESTLSTSSTSCGRDLEI